MFTKVYNIRHRICICIRVVSDCLCGTCDAGLKENFYSRQHVGRFAIDIIKFMEA